MKHLIVVAHPSETSFTMALTRSYAAELERLGHNHQSRDLYRMGFDPVLAAGELLPANSNHAARSDVVKAQEDIRSANVLTLIYPLWWMSMPAILKGYVDRVFARGFAYEAQEGIIRGLLSGKKAILITVSGAPLPVLVKNGRWNAVQVLQDTHILRSAGFDLLEHLHFDQVVPDLSKTVADEYLARVRACAQTHFAST